MPRKVGRERRPPARPLRALPASPSCHICHRAHRADRVGTARGIQQGPRRSKRAPATTYLPRKRLGNIIVSTASRLLFRYDSDGYIMHLSYLLQKVTSTAPVAWATDNFITKLGESPP